MEILSTAPGYNALRRGRTSLAGQIYLVTFNTHGRRSLFLDFEIAARTCACLAAPALWSDSRLLCWVLMPDHWHGIVELGERDDLSTLVCRVKATSATAFNRWHRTHGSVWAAGFHDHAVRHEEDLIGIARYVVANPIRQGICSRTGDYPFWDAVWI